LSETSVRDTCFNNRFEEPVTMQTSNEVAAAILVQTLVDHHPTLQATIREGVPDPKPLAQLLAQFYKAMVEEMTSNSSER
jgi:hypothetical protein